MTTDWSGDGVFGTIGKGIREYNADSLALDTIRSIALGFVQNYIQYNASIVFGSTGRSFSEVLEDMITAMETDAQTVKKNTIDEGGHAFYGSATPTLAGGKFAPTQMIQNDDFIKVECIQATTGAERWRITSMRRGQANTIATTGVAYPSSDANDQVGISFTIEDPSAGAYTVGDYFYVGPTYSDDLAVIQSFFRDAIGRVLPSAASGSETISDTLAEDNSVISS